MTLNTGKGKLSVYHGHAEAEKDGTMVFVKDAEFHMKEDGMEADSLGERTCLCAYEKEDYSGNEYRFRDDPVEENYDCTGLVVQVMGGLVIMGGVTIASGIVATAVGAGASATMIMGATAVGGTTFVAGLAATDLISRRVSSMEEYMKTALAGSVVGALTGAAELVPVGGLVRVGVDFLAGASGSAAGQLITEGEVDAERMFREGVLAAVMAAGVRMLRGGIKADIEENADISVEKRYRDWDGEIPRSGEEWCEYFEEKYGAENVEWLTGNNTFELSDVLIHRSLGARARNYDIVIPDGRVLHFTEGSRITNIKVIAGKGRNRQIDIVDILVDRYGGNPEEWQKCKGFGYVDVDGENLLAEVHWYQEPTVGKVAFKIKEQPGGEIFIYED